MSTYPSGLDVAIQDEDVGIIVPQFLTPAIQNAYNTDNFDLLDAVLNRLLDPNEEFDDILSPEDLVAICTSIGPSFEEFMRNINSITDETLKNKKKSTLQRIQGTIAWVGLSSVFIIIGSLVNDERKWYKNPSVDFTPNPETSSILSSIQPFITAFNPITAAMKESNFKFSQFNLLYTLSYLYLQYATGLQAYFSNRLMEAGNVLDAVHHSSTDIISYINSAVDTTSDNDSQTSNEVNTLINNEDIASIINKRELLPQWLEYDKVESYLKNAQKQSFMRLLTFVAVLPHNSAKLKLLTSLHNNDYFITQRSVVDLWFFSPVSARGSGIGETQNELSGQNTSLFDQFYLLVPSQLLYNVTERVQAQAITFSLTDCVDKLSTNRTLTNYEIAMLSAINKTPKATIQQLNYPREALKQLYPNANSDDSAMTDGITMVFESPFTHALISPLLQHNILTISTFTTTISFSQLCVMFGLNAADHASSMGNLIRDMIIQNVITPGHCKIDAIGNNIDDTQGVQGQSVTFLALKNNNLDRIQETMNSRSRFLRLVYDTSIDAERYARQLNKV